MTAAMEGDQTVASTETGGVGATAGLVIFGD